MEKSLNKKGFVFTLDITIGLIIVVIILLSANYYITNARGPSLSNLQLTKRGSDDLLIVYYQNALVAKADPVDNVLRLNQTVIFETLTRTRIPSYNIQFALNGTGYLQYNNITVGDPRLSRVQTGSGRMIFVLHDNKKISGFYTVRYYIWTR